MANEKKIFASPDGVIQLPEAGLENMLRQRDGVIQEHLDQMNRIQAVEGSAINAVVLAAIQNSGLPPVSQQEAFFEAAKALGQRISNDQLTRRALMIKQLLKELNMHHAREALVWGCKQAGVDLFDPDPRDAKPVDLDDKQAQLEGAVEAEEKKLVQH